MVVVCCISVVFWCYRVCDVIKFGGKIMFGFLCDFGGIVINLIEVEGL